MSGSGQPSVRSVVRSAISGRMSGSVDVDERDAHAGPDAELVEQRRGVDALHRRYRAMHAAGLRAALDVATTSGRDIRSRHDGSGRGSTCCARSGREPGLAPEPATDDELRVVPRRALPGGREAVLRRSRSACRRPGSGRAATTRPSPGMHEAAAAVAGGSIRAMEAILRGDVEHAFHPGGGLHHAMPERASGFCIYDDPALAIARARHDGLRVLYVDLDVHHGDGVQAIHWADPGVLTLSFHETGRYLFPGTGGAGGARRGGRGRHGRQRAARARARARAPWLAAVRTLLPELAAAFGPDVIVSQHGADSHAWDPLAHLRVTTTAMGAAARLVDARRPPARRRPLAGDRWRRL